MNEIRNSDTFNQAEHEEILKMEKNIEKIQSINRKRKEEAEAAILAARKAAEAEQAAREAAAALAAAEAAAAAEAEAEAQRIQNLTNFNQAHNAIENSEDQVMQTETSNEDEMITENGLPSTPSQIEPSLDTKIEKNVFMKQV